MKKPNSTHQQVDDDDTEPTPAESLHIWHLDRATNTGNYFTFNRSYYKIMSKLEALFIQDLINLSNCSVREGRWFLCTTEYLEKKGWSRREQVKHLKSLSGGNGEKKPKIVHISHRIMEHGRARWVSINRKQIESLLDKVYPDPGLVGGSTPTRAHPTTPTRVTTNVVVPTTVRNYKGAAGSGADAPSRHPNAAVNPNPEETDMATPLVDESPSTKDKGKTPRLLEVDTSRSKKLRHLVQQQGWFVSKSKKNWVVSFAVLRKERTPEVIDSLLDWYVRTGLENPALFSKLPQARNGHDFRRLFDWLSDKKGREEKNNPAVVVTTDAAHVVGELSLMGWPAAVKANMPQAVQASINGLKEFKNKLRVVMGRNIPTLSSYAKAVAENVGQVDYFVQNWFQVNNSWVNRNTFCGTAMSISLNTSDEKFKARVHPGQAGWGEKWWDRLMKEIQ